MYRKALAVLTLLSGTATAQTPAPLMVQGSAPACTTPSVADTVALEDVPDSNLRTVPVTINGAKKHFLLAIGTNLTEVSSATVSQLGLPDVRNAPSDHFTPYPGVDIYKEQTAHANFDMNVQVAATIFNLKGAS